MTVFELKDLLLMKKDHYPISDDFNDTHGQVKNVFWNSQKEHLLPWLDAQATRGSGSFTRKKPNTDAKTMYAHLSCPECQLWLAEAAGVDSELIQKAADVAKKLDRVVSRAAIIRRTIPWSTIEIALMTTI